MLRQPKQKQSELMISRYHSTKQFEPFRGRGRLLHKPKPSLAYGRWRAKTASAIGSMLGGFGHHVSTPPNVAAAATGQRVFCNKHHAA